MAAPTPTARTTPTGFKMPDGFKTLWTFASKPGVQLWEQKVKPPPIDGGDGIDTNTMHNTTWRTKDAKKLKTLDVTTFLAAYDPDVITDIFALINSNQGCTVTFPDGSTLAFWGFMTKFEPPEHAEGEFPIATVTVCPSNWDPVGRVEAGPVFSAAPGT